jgi:hypothetical protein
VLECTPKQQQINICRKPERRTCEPKVQRRGRIIHRSYRRISCSHHAELNGWQCKLGECHTLENGKMGCGKQFTTCPIGFDCIAQRNPTMGDKKDNANAPWCEPKSRFNKLRTGRPSIAVKLCLRKSSGFQTGQQ